MNLAGYELQIFATVLVILACALVALLVDYLKGSNEKLRESHVDLLVRQEHTGHRAASDTQLLLHGIAEQTEALRRMAERPIQIVGLPAAVARTEAASTLADIPVTAIPEPRREAPREAVAEQDKVKVSLIPDSKVLPESTVLRESTTPSPAVAPAAAAPAVSTPAIPAQAATLPLPPAPHVVVEAPSPALPANVVPIRAEAGVAPEAEPHDFDRFLDDLVTEFESNPGAYENPLEPTSPEEPEPLEAAQAPAPVVAAAAAAGSSSLDKPPFTGLVVSIGINEFEQVNTDLLNSINDLLERLRGGEGQMTRPQPDVVVLAYAGLTGPLAQRKLNDLSERLWDFQLRNLGSFNVVFSWGAKDANQEALEDAISAATERMQETQLSRKSNSLERMRKRLATA